MVTNNLDFISFQIFFVATIATVLAVPYYPALQVYSNGAVAPVETPEVQHEKAKHFAAHAERSHGYGPVHAVYSAPHAYGYHVPVIHNGKSKFIIFCMSIMVHCFRSQFTLSLFSTKIY